MSRYVLISLMAAFIMMLAGVAGAYALTLHQIAVSDQAWCGALDLLTAKPIPKTAGAEYQLYVNLLKVEQQFGCTG